MLTRTLVAAAAAMLLAGCSESGPTGPAGPDPRELKPSLDRTVIGVPGTPNCVGQTVAATAQGAKNLGLQDFRGLAGIAELGLFGSVSNLQAAIEVYCTTGVFPQ